MNPIERDELRFVTISAHAEEKMALRDVTPEDFAKALLAPEVIEPSEDGLRYVRGGIAYVVARRKGRPVLVTVLLRSGKPWTDADARERRR
jgi:hypothetical protein